MRFFEKQIMEKSRVVLPSISEMPIDFNLCPGISLPELRCTTSHPTEQKTKGSWSKEEDDLLRSAVAQSEDPICWEHLSKKVPGRSPKQCRERWLFRLSPQVSKLPFEKWEDELIVIERLRLGNHWTLIAQKLPGRTSCAVKNRWYTVLRERVRYSEKLNEERARLQTLYMPPVYPYYSC